MVFISVLRYIRCRGPDELWRKRKILKMSAHYIGRKRNCYSLAIMNVHRALVYATKGRKLKKEDMANLWTTRVTAACEEHNLEYKTFREALTRSNILLNRKTLADLACWEPYTFKALTDIAKQRAVQDGLNSITNNDSKLDGIVTRGSLNKK